MMFMLAVGTYVAVGSEIKINYLGSLCQLEVIEVVTESGETVSCDNSTNEARINDRLSSMNLSSETTIHQHSVPPRFFQCVNGTCMTLWKPLSAESCSSRAATALDDLGGVDSQKDFLTRLVSSMLDVDRTNAIKQSGELYYIFKIFVNLCCRLFVSTAATVCVCRIRGKIAGTVLCCIVVC